jgi:SP family arabinose:H+ symporter-like MFS transporter
LRVALLVGVGLAFFGQLTGVNIVVYYGPTVLGHAGFEKIGAFQFQVAFGLTNLVFTLIALALIDHLGRRPLLLSGMTVVVLALATTGVLFFYGDPQIVPNVETGRKTLALTNKAVGPWIAGVLAVYMACVALSICAVIWVLTPEIFPNRVRGRAMSIATLTNWGTNAVSAFLFPWYVTAFGMHTGFLTFAAICLVGTVFFWRLVPETKGRSLEEIERMWQRRPAPQSASVSEFSGKGGSP